MFKQNDSDAWNERFTDTQEQTNLRSANLHSICSITLLDLWQ